MIRQWRYGIPTEGSRNTKSSQASIVQYTVGEQVQHPKFGEGCIEKIEQATGSVTLHIRFGNEIKVIDQKWLLRTKYQKKE